MRTKSANEIRKQGKRIMCNLGLDDKTRNRYFFVTSSLRRYLANIAKHYNKPYSGLTWDEIGDNKVSRNIYDIGGNQWVVTNK